MKMSFLEQLNRKRSNLISVETKLTKPNGDVVMEKSGKRVGKSFGFIIDTKPDLIIARVVPRFYFGSQDITQNFDMLIKYDIKMIISVGVDVTKYDEIIYNFVECFDLPEFNIIDIFDRCFTIINKYMERNKTGSVYLHCNAGLSRSASIAIGYLIKFQNMNYQNALDYLKEQRPNIKPNEGFIKQLLEFEKAEKIKK